MDRDRRLTGFLRGQTDNPAAPAGFELNNPWRVRTAKDSILSEMLTGFTAREADHVERAGNGIVHTYYGKSRIKVMKLHMTQGFPVIFPPSAEYRCFLIADSDLDYRAMRHVLLPRYQYLGPCPGFEHRNWPWILRQQLIPSCLHSAWTKITIFLALPESASNRIQGICKAPACLDDASDS